MTAFSEQDAEVYEGLLHCRNGHFYPIVRSIPRILAEAFDQEPQFGKRYQQELAQQGLRVKATNNHSLYERTRKSFGYEWTKYSVQRPEEDRAYFRSKTGTEPEFLREKLVLDAGCGSGRYTQVAGEAGATVIGVDLGQAVETAACVNKDLPNVHLVQANLFELPFAPGTFDFAYSIGVLHHTPNTKQALDRLIPMVKGGGEIAIWLYPRWPLPIEVYNSALRAITTRLDLDLLHRIAVRVEPIGLLKLQLLTSNRKSKRVLGQLLRGLTIGISYHPDREIRICDTFDWFSPPYQWHHTDAEVESWLKGYGLIELGNLSIGVHHYQYNYGNGVNFKARLPVRGKQPLAKPVPIKSSPTN